MKRITTLIAMLLLVACSSAPTPVAPVVSDFNATKYLGKWYEVLRLPHGFEEGLTAVTAEYRLNSDNSIEVTNRGFHQQDGEWQTAIGHAVPVSNAMYRVTFFWPFDGGYYVSWLEEDEDGNYLYAIVTSDNHDYFWLLSRTPQVPEMVINMAMARAKEWGYATDQIMQVAHPTESRFMPFNQ